MLEFLSGRVVATSAEAAVIAVGGVGIRCQMPATDLMTLSGDVTVHTVLVIKDEDVQLYAFSTDRGRELFRALRGVNGVGPKIALAVLSFYSPDELDRILATGDVNALTKVSGIGRKGAERIALELRDKLIVPDMPPAGGVESPITEVRQALEGMGYSSVEISSAVKDLPSDGDAVTLLRFALRNLGEKT